MNSGLLRIQAVTELTGIPAATLRAWERRYGVPLPSRTASAYRLYGERDVEMVREMQRLCAAGNSAAEAARIVLARAAGAPKPVEGQSIFDATKTLILNAVERYDSSALEAALAQASMLGNAHETYERVIAPTLVEIGDRWHSGRFSIAQEHFATERMMEALRTLLRLVQPAQAQHTVVAACFADEEHSLGAIGASLAMAMAGCRVVSLGARTPPEALGDAARSIGPDLLALSITVAPPPLRTRELLADYARAAGKIPWVVGGRAIADVAPRVLAAGGYVAEGAASDWQKHLRDWLRGPRKPSVKRKGK